jgi:hypothetical protein
MERMSNAGSRVINARCATTSRLSIAPIHSDLFQGDRISAHCLLPVAESETIRQFAEIVRTS